MFDYFFPLVYHLAEIVQLVFEGGKDVLKKPVHVLRMMGILDGISLLILIGVAMPLKYMADLPIFVTIFGGLHGFIFIVYVLSILYATVRVRWNILWSILAFAAAFVPLGNFIFDLKLKKLATKFDMEIT